MRLIIIGLALALSFALVEWYSDSVTAMSSQYEATINEE